MTSFSSDGTLLATAQTDGLIRIWRLSGAASNGYQVIPGKMGGSLVKLFGDRHWMVSGMTKWTGNVRAVTIHENRAEDDRSVFRSCERESTDPDSPYNGHVMDAAGSPDLTRVVTLHSPRSRSGMTMKRAGNDAGTLRLWRFPEGTPLLEEALPMPSEPRSVDFHPNGKQIAVCTARMEIVLCNAETMEIESIMSPFDSGGGISQRETVFPAYIRNEQLLYSPDGDSIIVWGSKDGLLVLDTAVRALRFPAIENNNRRIASVEFSPDGTLVALAGGLNRVARVLDIQSGQFVGPVLEHPAAVNSARFSPDGTRLITGCRDGHVRIFHWKTGEADLDFTTHRMDVVDARWTADGRYFVTIGADELLRVWDEIDGPALKPFVIGPGAAQLLLTPDSRYAIVGGGMPAVHVFDLSELNRDPEFNLEKLRLSCELLSGKTFVNGTPTNISSKSWHELWQRNQGNIDLEQGFKSSSSSTTPEDR